VDCDSHQEHEPRESESGSQGDDGRDGGGRDQGNPHTVKGTEHHPRVPGVGETRMGTILWQS